MMVSPSLPPEAGIPAKRCTKCGGIKPLTEFHRTRGSADGHTWWCKACRKVVDRECRERRENISPDPPNPSKWVAFPCAWCGKEVRYHRTVIESRQRRGKPLPGFCSRRCAGLDQHRQRQEGA